MSETTNTTKKETLSSIFIPILLSKTDLERTLNEKIDGTIFDDKITEGNLQILVNKVDAIKICLLYTSPSPRDRTRSRMPSSA